MSYHNHPDNMSAQQRTILALLENARGAWVPLPEVMRCAAAYNARLWELRQMGYAIENRTKLVNGQRRSWYRLIPSEENSPQISSINQQHTSSSPIGDIESGFLAHETGQRR